MGSIEVEADTVRSDNGWGLFRLLVVCSSSSVPCSEEVSSPAGSNKNNSVIVVAAVVYNLTHQSVLPRGVTMDPVSRTYPAAVIGYPDEQDTLFYWQRLQSGEIDYCPYAWTSRSTRNWERVVTILVMWHPPFEPAAPRQLAQLSSSIHYLPYFALLDSLISQIFPCHLYGNE